MISWAIAGKLQETLAKVISSGASLVRRGGSSAREPPDEQSEVPGATSSHKRG